jgi:2-dehydropantoate 2-reductase
MNIVIVGPGAMGSLFSGLFLRPAVIKKLAGKVWLLDKNKERAHFLSRQGITVEGIAGTWHVPVCATTDINTIDKADIIILCVKSFSTKDAMLSIKPLIREHTKIMTLQNGIGNIEAIQEIAGEDRIIAGTTSLAATLINTGKVRFCGKGETIFGCLNGKIPVEMREIREIFNRSNLTTHMTRDLKGLIWSKLIINAAINPLTALTRLPNGKLLAFEGTRAILRDAATEATRVAKRKRIKLIYDDPLAKVESVCENTADNVSSMLQDITRSKRTEIDYLNGVIVRMGKELGIDVPVNAMLVDLIKTIENSYADTVRANTK